MKKITYYDKTGKEITKKEFLKSQKESLFDGKSVSMSVLRKRFTEKELLDMQDEGFIEIKKYKNKRYISQEEFLYAIKVLERRRIKESKRESSTPNLFD